MTEARVMSIPRQLFALAVPLVGLNLLAVLWLVVDAAVCGRLPDGEHALAALGLSIQLLFLLNVAMIGLATGTVALIARAYGAGETERLNHLLVQSSMMTVIIGCVIGALGIALARPMLTVLGASAQAVELGVQYLRTLLLGAPIIFLVLLYTGVLRGVGNTRIPFFCGLVAIGINIVLAYGLTLGRLGMPALGVRGAAIGTLIAQAVNLLLLIGVLRRGVIPNLHLPLRVAVIDRPLIGELYRVAAPAAADMIILNAGFLAALAMLGWIDEVTVAAHSVGTRIQGLAFLPGMGIAQATGAMVGQALGAGDVERARKVTRAALVLCCLLMTSLGLILLVFARPLVHAFDVRAGTPLETYSILCISILAVWMVPAAVHTSLLGLLQGAGATGASLRINFYTTLFLQVPVAAVLGIALDMGAVGVWLSFPISFTAKAVWGYVLYKQERWAVTGVRLQPPSRTGG